MSVDTVDPYRIVHTPLAERPWAAEVEVTADIATSLIEAQCPPLSPVSLEPMGAGWDNTAYLVNGDWVFRFRGAPSPCRCSKPKHAYCPSSRRGCQCPSRGQNGSDGRTRRIAGRFWATGGWRGEWRAT